MRLILVSFIPDNRWTGMGKWTHCIAARLREAGHEVTLKFSDDYPRLQRSGRLAVLLFPVFLAMQLASQRRSYDAVIIHEPSGFWYGLARKVWRSLPPMVVVCHNVESRNFRDLVAATQKGFASVSRAGRLKYALVRRWQSDGAVVLGDVVICLSRVDEQIISRRNEKVVRVVNGVDAPRITSSGRARTRVLFVGGWLDVKGKKVVPALWARVLSALPDARLTLAGTGVDADSVLSGFPSETRHSVTVIPRVTDPATMEGLYSDHGIFLMPSLSEGSSMALLEAMAAGLPSVVSAVGGLPDIITHGENALVFDSMDVDAAARHVVSLMRDTNLADRIGQRALESAARFTWTDTAASLMRAVDLAIGERGVRD